jgi:hypothetical protein
MAVLRLDDDAVATGLALGSSAAPAPAASCAETRGVTDFETTRAVIGQDVRRSPASRGHVDHRACVRHRTMFGRPCRDFSIAASSDGRASASAAA